MEEWKAHKSSRYHSMSGYITKDGHTMFVGDVVNEIKYIQSRCAKLEATIEAKDKLIHDWIERHDKLKEGNFNLEHDRDYYKSKFEQSKKRIKELEDTNKRAIELFDMYGVSNGEFCELMFDMIKLRNKDK